jgi:ABC-type amino acid transport substrate-binding protein
MAPVPWKEPAMAPLQLLSARTASPYPRPSRLRRAGTFALTAAGMLALACGGDKADGQGLTAAEWIETDGAAGRINLDDVRQAYREAYGTDGFSVNTFEQRVNEIYEGDNLVLIQAEQQGDRVLISGWEDLNGNKTLDPNEDDKLFTITQKLADNGETVVQGHGANAYYRESSFFSGFIPGLLLGQLFAGGRTVYVTPPPRYEELQSARGSYRSGSGYAIQRGRNASYGGSVASRYGPSATSGPVSPARSSYQSRQVNSGGFRSSGSTTRSIGSGGRGTGSSGSKSTGGGSGGKSGGTGGVSGGGGRLAL